MNGWEIEVDGVTMTKGKLCGSGASIHATVIVNITINVVALSSSNWVAVYHENSSPGVSRLYREKVVDGYSPLPRRLAPWPCRET